MKIIKKEKSQNFIFFTERWEYIKNFFYKRLKEKIKERNEKERSERKSKGC